MATATPAVFAGWAVMNEISWPVAIELGLATIHIIIALVNVYKKSEWPFRQNVEHVVEDAIKHAGYWHTQLPQSSEYIFNYEIKKDNTSVNIFKRRGLESLIFVSTVWGDDRIFDDWPDDKRKAFICDIKSDLLKLGLEHNVGGNPFTLTHKSAI
ncbi:MAG: hypothetical protein ACR2KU_00945 [Gammaproteobacteria bacterium]